MRRRLVWIDRKSFQGYRCSECAWLFKASGMPAGKSLDQMKRNYERQRDKHFADPVCAEHSRGRKTKD
jgi:hypothetical protein